MDRPAGCLILITTACWREISAQLSEQRLKEGQDFLVWPERLY
jgi:hypothetical protein